MLHARLADLVLATHLVFVVFVAIGGLLLFRWPRAAAFHLPCLLYGTAIELVGWVCPLTPLEQRLRAVAGQAGYEGGFIERYASQLLYPADWETVHLWLGICLVLLNLLIYGVWFRQVRARRRAG